MKFRTHKHVDGRNFRWWLYHKDKTVFSIEAAGLTGAFGIGLGAEEDWTASLRFGLASLYISFPIKKFRGFDDAREISISLHSGSLFWRFWTNPMSWTSDTPRWREGSFNFADFFLGRTKCEHRDLEARDVLIPMPERAYPASAKLQEWTWKRPRWFMRKVVRVEIEIPDGIPFPGKGESSWNCGDDATYSISTGPCRSIAEGVGILVGSVLRDRVKNGGYSDWTWKRPVAA